MKKENPYQRLKRTGQEYFFKVLTRKQINMVVITKEDIGKDWSLSNIYQCTIAAQRLGYQVVVEADDNELRFEYLEKLPNRPWEFKP